MLLLKSFILGFSVSAPVGPIGLLCIQRVLSRGVTAGFLTGLGAATANIIYSSIAAFGFTVASAFMLEQQFYLKIIGMIFLVYLGIKTFHKKPPQDSARVKGESSFQLFASTLLLMITNPVTIVNFAAMFAGLGFSGESSSLQMAVSLILGVFMGAVTWWLLLSIGVNLFKKSITPHLPIVNKTAGILLILLAFLSLA
ncbi:LysE family transporter [Rossellomorea sp. SC111]|uniref:LysE family translocator n=1 Tax=Rossellomorea sp. SC111 TaxID=2968985 RepID=UPI00215A99AF|nr:LysE family transporter [Rossellomorea sp. SC111]MCR8849828.1 LysE family transporter [Rossellomorea sp. SC111]